MDKKSKKGLIGKNLWITIIGYFILVFLIIFGICLSEKQLPANICELIRKCYEKLKENLNTISLGYFATIVSVNSLIFAAINIIVSRYADIEYGFALGELWEKRFMPIQPFRIFILIIGVVSILCSLISLYAVSGLLLAYLFLIYCIFFYHTYFIIHEKRKQDIVLQIIFDDIVHQKENMGNINWKETKLYQIYSKKDKSQKDYVLIKSIYEYLLQQIQMSKPKVDLQEMHFQISYHTARYFLGEQKYRKVIEADYLLLEEIVNKIKEDLQKDGKEELLRNKKDDNSKYLLSVLVGIWAYYIIYAKNQTMVMQMMRDLSSMDKRSRSTCIWALFCLCELLYSKRSDIEPACSELLNLFYSSENNFYLGETYSDKGERKGFLTENPLLKCICYQYIDDKPFTTYDIRQMLEKLEEDFININEGKDYCQTYVFRKYILLKQRGKGYEKYM